MELTEIEKLSIKYFEDDKENDDLYRIYLRSVRYGVLNFILDFTYRSSLEQIDNLFRDIDAASRDFSPILSFSEAEIKTYIGHILSNHNLLALIMHVWSHINISLDSDVIENVNKRMVNSCRFALKQSKVITFQMMQDLPRVDSINEIIKEIPWLFLPKAIYIYANFELLEEIVFLTKENHKKSKLSS